MINFTRGVDHRCLWSAGMGSWPASSNEKPATSRRVDHRFLWSAQPAIAGRCLFYNGVQLATAGSRFFNSARLCSSLFFALALAAQGATNFSNTVQPFVAKNCVLCHNTQAKVGGLDLSAYHTEADVIKNRDVWERVASRVKNHEMPPKGRPAPADAEIAKVTEWIDGTMEKADRTAAPDPGRVTARRLNRVEYSNTIRDLLAVNFSAADSFPPDDFGYGFDNIGDVLSLSPS